MPSVIGKAIFGMYALGALLLGGAILLFIYGFQGCKATANPCSNSVKTVGPALAVVSLGVILLASARARLEAVNNPGDPIVWGKSRISLQLIVFGFVLTVSGVLMVIVNFWVPGCEASSLIKLNPKSTCRQIIIGGLSTLLLGLGVLVVGIKKWKTYETTRELDPEEQAIQNGLYPLYVGHELVTFPLPPPQYFDDPSLPPPDQNRLGLSNVDLPPSYESLFITRTRTDQEDLYNYQLVFMADPTLMFHQTSSSLCGLQMLRIEERTLKMF